MVQTNSVDPQMTKLFSSTMFGEKQAAASHTGAFNNLRNTETITNKPLINDGF